MSRLKPDQEASMRKIFALVALLVIVVLTLVQFGPSLFG